MKLIATCKYSEQCITITEVTSCYNGTSCSPMSRHHNF